ncbi:ATP-binding protein [Streptomyces sp. NPDC088707]|uniref:ATP-binding protein n=1 Tax=Streptomyces sp. NPDC088707 TaxID=3365871 RepID=UPI00381C3ECC
MLETLDARPAQAYGSELVTSTSSRSSTKTRSPAVRPSPSNDVCSGRSSSSRSRWIGVRLHRPLETARSPDPRPRRTRWLHAGESVILFGPVGVGKTHIAQTLGHLAVRQGAHVRFAKTSRILAELAGGHADRTWEKRLRELIRPDVLILDDFPMRQLSAAQADDLYELVSERQGRSLIITSNRASSDWYPLFPTPSSPSRSWTGSINTSHQVIMNGPSYRPYKRPRNTTDKVH